LFFAQNLHFGFCSCKEKEEKQAILLLASVVHPCRPLAKVLIVRTIKERLNFASG
jgi:hypothetical protein